MINICDVPVWWTRQDLKLGIERTGRREIISRSFWNENDGGGWEARSDALSFSLDWSVEGDREVKVMGRHSVHHVGTGDLDIWLGNKLPEWNHSIVESNFRVYSEWKRSLELMGEWGGRVTAMGDVTGCLSTYTRRKATRSIGTVGWSGWARKFSPRKIEGIKKNEREERGRWAGLLVGWRLG